MRHKLHYDEIQEIWDRYEEGESIEDIAARFEVSQSWITQLVANCTPPPHDAD